MNDLSPETRQLLDEARGGDEPTDSDRRRVRGALFAQIGVSAAIGTAAASTSGSAAAAGASALSLVTKVILGVAVVAGAAIGGVALKGALVPSAQHAAPAISAGAPKSAAPIAIAVAPSSSVAPNTDAPSPSSEPREAPPPEASVASADTSTPKTSPPPRISPRSSSTTPAPADTLGREIALLQRTNEALNSGDGKAALADLDEHAREFPNGKMNEEREALQVLALCAAGREDDARAAAKRFLAAHPSSPAAERVRASCGGGVAK